MLNPTKRHLFQKVGLMVTMFSTPDHGLIVHDYSTTDPVNNGKLR